jgi:predicted nucleic acid-binding protein
VATVLVDSNVLLDLFTDDPHWAAWSGAALADLADRHRLVINVIVYAEVSIGFSRKEDLDAILPRHSFEREPVPEAAAFLAGKAFLAYLRRSGTRRSLLPDFLIGAHAAVAGHTLLTRDAARYRTYFPTVKLIAPA